MTFCTIMKCHGLMVVCNIGIHFYVAEILLQSLCSTTDKKQVDNLIVSQMRLRSPIGYNKNYS